MRMPQEKPRRAQDDPLIPNSPFYGLTYARALINLSLFVKCSPDLLMLDLLMKVLFFFF